LTCTSAQIGYTVPFTLVHAGKYRTEDKLKIHTIYILNATQKKANNAKHSKTKLPGLVASDDTWQENEVGLFYNAPEPTAVQLVIT